MTITPISPANRERLVPRDATIIVRSTAAITLVKVDGTTAWNGSFQAGWSGALATRTGTWQLSLDPPAPFAIGHVVAVEAHNAGESLAWSYIVGTERVTTGYSSRSPRVVETAAYSWAAGVDDPGSLYMHKLDPLTSRVLVVKANVVDVGYDPVAGKLVVATIVDGKVFTFTADPGDAPSTLVQPTALLDSARRPASATSGVASHGQTAYTPIKKSPSELAASQDQAWSGLLASDMSYDVPTTHVASVPPFDVTRVDIYRPSAGMEYLVGYNVFKTTWGTPVIVGFVAATQDDAVVSFFDSTWNVGAAYAAQPVFKRSADYKLGNVGPFSTSNPTLSEPVYFQAFASTGFVQYGSTQYPPQKQSLVDYNDVFGVAATGVTYISIGAYEKIGVG